MRGEICAGEHKENVSYIINGSQLFKYTAVYLVGIVFGSRIFINTHILILLASAVLSSCFILYYLNYHIKRSGSFEKILPSLFVISMFMAGWINIQFTPSRLFSVEESEVLEKGDHIADCILTERMIKKEKSYKVCARVAGGREKMILYIDNRFPAGLAEPGDTLRVLLRPRKISGNINGFDYGRYLGKQEIYTSSYVSLTNTGLKKRIDPGLFLRVSRFKSRYIGRILESKRSQDHAAMQIAILTGDKSYLEEDTRNAFSASGTMHLLAVSGLHTGFLFSFLSFLLLPAGKCKISQYTRYLLLLAFLWLYAAVTGLSPSVCRAAVMLTVHETSKMYERGGSLFNSLTISALIITVVNPESLFNLGFQLSYISILSIIFIHPAIFKCHIPGNKVVKYLWSMLSISLACQAGTSLITISRFGYIPIYFLLTNLLAIPLTAVILFLSAAEILFPATFCSIIETTNVLFLDLLGFYTARIESLPYSSLKVTLNEREITIIAILILFTTLRIPEDKKMRLYICFGLVISFIINLLLV
jgi:ComEC/Rec2-related protein